MSVRANRASPRWRPAGRSGGAAEQGHRVGGHSTNLELQVEMRPNRKPGAAHQADLVALLHELTDRHGDRRHMCVDLNQPVAVGHLDANTEVKCRTYRRHLAARGCANRSAVAREDVDAGVEMEVAVVRGLELERRRTELLDDRGGRDRAYQLARLDRVGRRAGREIR